MAEPIPQKPSALDESKKDTVRINLPPVTSKSTTGVPANPPTVKIRPASAPVSPEEEAKQETAVMGRPAAPAAPKSDTSRVAVPAAKPSAPEVPRPTVKLRREDDAPVAATVAPATKAAPTMAPVVAAAPSGADTGLAMTAMLVSLITLAYLAVVALG
jgi:hypothetical protein